MSTEHSKPRRLAAAALDAGMAGKWSLACRYIRRINDECDQTGLVLAILGWVDTVIDHIGDGDRNDRRRPVRLQFWETSTGAVGGADQPTLPPSVRLAGQLVAARAAGDDQAFWMLMSAMPTNGVDIGEDIIAILHVTATTIGSTPRGIALAPGGAR